MEPQDRRPPPLAEEAGYRETVLRQVRELTEDNQRLFQSVVKSEKRFRTLAKAVWRIQEEERRRLARELHDGIGQTLTALANQLQRIADDARAQENLGLEHRLTDALDITRGALHDTRELSRLLRPTLLDDLGLPAALGWLARTLGERTGIKIELHSNLGEQRLPADIETLVFRITQEALTNVIRHSRAQEAQILLTHAAGLLRLRVRDHGQGFEPAELNTPDRGASHSGLRGMRDRAELFGGRIDISSAPNEGTTVQLTLPLESAEEPAARTLGAA
ncbi:MAG TPA: sensor histidine kinase [Nevskiaceae bacterium]|nr:sensor histidine kinase [Nevskiaceae bacterium]